MPFEFWYTLSLLILMSVLLVKEWLEAELVLFTTLLLLVIGKVVTVKEAFSGFSNEGMLTIGLLFIVAGALHSTGALNQINYILFGKNKGSVSAKLARILFPVSAVSAFINNTPVVAVLIPAIRSWTEKFRYSPSKFLIPLSYAAILGGMSTLIGTSTNLIVHGLLIESGQQGFGFFEISRVGVPVALAGLLYIVLIGHRFLPDRKELIVELGEKTREFVIELKVKENYEHVGKTIEAAGLRHLSGLFLFQIERDGKLIAPAGPEEHIEVGDRLFFTGIPKTILELQKTPGLQLIKDSHFDLKQYDSAQIKSYEAVVSPSSPLVGKNVRDSNFRSRYNAVIIAIHRNGERIQKKIGDIVLQPGDTLLLLADKQFRKKWYHTKDFYLISDAAVIPSKPQPQVYIAVASLVGMVLLTVLNILPILGAAGLAVIVLLLTKTMTPAEAQESINWRVLIIIAFALGISVAIQNSRLADVIGQIVIQATAGWGVIGAMIGLYVLTSIYTTIITSNATAAIIFPIAVSTALALDTAVRPFALTITIAAAASFASPIAYQTNLMVYGPGGYRFSDFLKIGVPLQILSGIIAIALIYMIYF